MVRRAFKYRFYPTPEQATELARTFGACRYVYNRTLAERSRAYTQEHRKITYAESARWVALWRHDPETAWLGEIASVPLQQAVRHLQAAFVNFWAKTGRYPTFKSKHKSRASATYTTFGFSYRDGQVRLAKMADPLDIRWSRPLPPGAEPSSVTVGRDAAGRHHISILVETDVGALAPVVAQVGVDAGITTLMTLSTGEKITNPRHERKDRARLALVQRRLARKQKGSNNRGKAKLAVAKVHARIADRRRDHLHKLTTRLIRENQTVIVEDLTVRNMVRNHPLARAISDASWSEVRRQLEYKAGWYGREVIAIDRWYPSSKTCSACGHLLAKLPLGTRAWTCPGCGTLHDRDVNAARNILAVGLTVAACGDGVRPART
jgi:putative transposase